MACLRVVSNTFMSYFRTGFGSTKLSLFCLANPTINPLAMHAKQCHSFSLFAASFNKGQYTRSKIRRIAHFGIITQIINYSNDYNIGDELPDGWTVARSPTIGKPIAIEPESSALKGNQTWRAGEEHAEELRVQGHEYTRQPNDAELHVLRDKLVDAGFNEHAKINTNGFEPFGKLWGSTSYLEAHPKAKEKTKNQEPRSGDVL